MHPPLAIWLFGPIGSGKSSLAAGLPLPGFRRVQPDIELERRLSEAGLPHAVAAYDEPQKAAFRQLRSEILEQVWGQVPAWRAAGEDILFETTGSKPPDFRRELEAGRRYGYRSLGCGLRMPLAECQARNRSRRRVLQDEVVTATWEAFERCLADGTYARLFAGDTLLIHEKARDAETGVRAWLAAE